MSVDIDMAEIAQLFIDESMEGLDIMESGLLNLDLGAADPETMNSIFRAAHSIKGGGATFGFTEISEFAHHVETLLDEMRQGDRPVTREGVDLTLQSVDCIRDMITALGEGAIDTTRADALVVQLEKMLQEKPGEESASGQDTAADVVPSEEAVVETEEKAVASKTAEPPARPAGSKPGGWRIEFKPAREMFKSGNDPIRMLREIAKMGDVEVSVSGAKDLRFGEFDAEQCFLAWDIELKCSECREAISEVFAWVEGECELNIEPLEDDCPAEPEAEEDTGLIIIGGESDNTSSLEKTEESDKSEGKTDSDGNANVTSEDKEESTRAEQKATTKESSDSGSGGGNEASQQTPVASKPPAKPKPASSSKENSSIRVNIDKVDALINLVGELVITQSMLSRFNGEFDFNQLEGLREGLTQLSRNTRELQESVMAIRMLPISFAFSRFPRLVRDTGNALEKKVELRLNGENTELDKTVLEKIGDPLVHLVRNSLDHGLERPEARVAAGKPETGILELNAYHEGGNIIIDVVDDGAGINKERVLQKARERGLVGADEILSDDKINNLIFMAGFSTVDEISDLSGRGVGMDVVRRNISDLGGHVSVKSETGVGSKFTIRLPLTLAILDGQLVRVGSHSYIISLVSIVETIQASADRVNEVAGTSELFKLRDEYLPVLRLHELFDVEADSTQIDQGLLVVAEANGHRVGVFVDDLLEQQQVVIKSLEANYKQTPGISGATILGDGTVALILDVPGLIQLFYEKKSTEQNTLIAAA